MFGKPVPLGKAEAADTFLLKIFTNYTLSFLQINSNYARAWEYSSSKLGTGNALKNKHEVEHQKALKSVW